jgi:nucleotide-binding universal stress UspA family protein
VIEQRAPGPELHLAVELPEHRGIGKQLAGLLRDAASGAVSARHLMLASPTVQQPPARRWRSIDTIIVGSDGSDTATVAVGAAVDPARAFSATLHVVCAYRASEQRPEALTALASAQADVRELGLLPRCHARQGEAAIVLGEVAEERDADVIVVGSQGLSGATRLRASVPNTVSRRATCSVLIVRTV